MCVCAWMYVYMHVCVLACTCLCFYTNLYTHDFVYIKSSTGNILLFACGYIFHLYKYKHKEKICRVTVVYNITHTNTYARNDP